MGKTVEKAKIMVVEDEAITARDLQLRLQHMGYDVPLIVATGEGAVEKAGEVKPDLVLMDIMLQGQIDGIEAARQIHLKSDIPIIYLSAYADKMLSERSKDTDPYGYLSKPFAENDLCNIIEMALYKHSMDKTLREETKFTEKAIDAQIDTFFVFDPKTGKAIRWNKSFREITGYTDEEITELKAPNSYCSPEDLEKAAAVINDVLINGQARVEISLICKDGRRILTEYLVSAIRDEENNIKHIISIGRDITERKRSEEALKDSEEKFAKAFQYAATIISISTINEGRFINVNDAFLKVLGFKREEVIGKTSIELNIFEDPAQREAIKQMIQEKGNVHDYELKARTKNGSFRWGMVSFDVIQLKGESYFLTVMNDITELRNAMESLRKTLQTSNDIFETIPSGLFIYQFEQPDSLFLLNGNPESEILSDIKVKDWIGKGFDEIWPEADKRGLSSELLEVMRTGKTYVTDNFYYKDRKLEGFFKIHAFRLPCDRLAVAFENITESKKNEEMLKKTKEEVEALNRDLEKRVREKTEELTSSQAQLIQSEKLAAMGQMAGGLAHELNSPLAGLLPMIEKHKDKADKGSEYYKELSLMYSACEYMAKVVRDFWAFSRESKGEVYGLNVNEVIEDTLSFSASRIKQKGIRVFKEFEGKLPKLLGEKTELQQVVLVFISNALDAITEGGELKIRTSTSENMDNVIIEFIDNGIGIEKDKLDKIFDPFYTTKRPGKGTGLGLSVSYKTIEKYGGKITVQSEPGKGSKFSVYLPAVRSNNA